MRGTATTIFASRKIILALLLPVYFLFPTIAIAASTEISAGVTPDSPFYFIDVALEKLGLFFTLSREKRVEKILLHAEERIAEMKAVEGDPSLVEKALGLYQKGMDVAIKESLDESDEDVSNRLLENVADKLIEHRESFEELVNFVPEDVKESIESVLEASRIKYDEAINQISEPENQIEKLENKIEEFEKITPSAIVPDVIDPPTCRLAASSEVIPRGSPVTITWSTTNASYVADSGGKNNANGSIVFTPDSLPYNYSITAYGEGGSKSCNITITEAEASATINASSLSSSSFNPTISGTAEGVLSVAFSLGDDGGKVYGSGDISISDSGKWSHTISTALTNGTYTISLYGSNNDLLTEETLTIGDVTFDKTPDTLKIYVDGALFVEEINLSETEALELCILTSTDNPWPKYVYCEYNDIGIFDSLKG